MSDRARLFLLAVLALFAGAFVTLAIGFGLRFLWVAYGHGGFF